MLPCVVMSTLTKIGIISKPDEHIPEQIIEQLLSVFRSRDIDLFVDASVTNVTGYPVLSREELAETIDTAIVIGGDGTLLHASRSLVDRDIPIIGVNIGRIGFLVDISPNELESTLESILKGRYQIEERILLYATVMRNGQSLFEGIALNDVSVHVRDSIRMMEFETHIDGSFVSKQRADGLVVATPTGSTAYALSSGGPVVHPGLDTFTLVPVCPHTLTSRPVVISADSQITLTQVADTDTLARIALDGHNTFNIEPGDQLIIKRHTNKLKLIHPQAYDYFQILRKKLRWNEQL